MRSVGDGEKEEAAKMMGLRWAEASHEQGAITGESLRARGCVC